MSDVARLRTRVALPEVLQMVDLAYGEGYRDGFDAACDELAAVAPPKRRGWLEWLAVAVLALGVAAAGGAALVWLYLAGTP